MMEGIPIELYGAAYVYFIYQTLALIFGPLTGLVIGYWILGGHRNGEARR
jgi:hypothetical protein